MLRDPQLSALRRYPTPLASFLSTEEASNLLLIWGRLTPFQPWTDSPNCRPLWVGYVEAGVQILTLSSFLDPSILGEWLELQLGPPTVHVHTPLPQWGPCVAEKRGEDTILSLLVT